MLTREEQENINTFVTHLQGDQPIHASVYWTNNPFVQQWFGEGGVRRHGRGRNQFLAPPARQLLDCFLLILNHQLKAIALILWNNNPVLRYAFIGFHKDIVTTQSDLHRHIFAALRCQEVNILLQCFTGHSNFNIAISNMPLDAAKNILHQVLSLKGGKVANFIGQYIESIQDSNLLDAVIAERVAKVPPLEEQKHYRSCNLLLENRLKSLQLANSRKAQAVPARVKRARNETALVVASAKAQKVDEWNVKLTRSPKLKYRWHEIPPGYLTPPAILPPPFKTYGQIMHEEEHGGRSIFYNPGFHAYRDSNSTSSTASMLSSLAVSPLVCPASSSESPPEIDFLPATAEMFNFCDDEPCDDITKLDLSFLVDDDDVVVTGQTRRATF